MDAERWTISDVPYMFFLTNLQLTWFKDGQRLVESSKVKSTFDGKTSSLLINSVNSSDTGHYTLLAENPAGK